MKPKERIKIVAPASTLDEVEAYENLGVDEIYLGFMDVEKDRWKTINKRVKSSANFMSLDDLKKVKEYFSGEVSFTINSPFFDGSQLEDLKNQIKNVRYFVDNFIVADPSIISLVRDLAPNNGIIISCIATTLNSDTARFYKGLGVKKIILPRHLTLDEIENMVKNSSDIEFEVMILNQFCRNVDGFCSRCHIRKDNVDLTNCNIPFSFNLIPLSREVNDFVKSNLSSYLRFNPWCGLCFIKRLQSVGVSGLKIVGRSNSFEKKVGDVKLVKEVINSTKLGDVDFERLCKNLFVKNLGGLCKDNCYY